MKNRIRYLVVKFHDNDFGSVVSEAMRKLYKIVIENSYGTTVIEGLEKFHKEGHLKPALMALIDAAYINSKVEQSTRGLRNLVLVMNELKKPYKLYAEVPVKPYEFISEYLKIEIKFHKNDSFFEWDDGESAYLDLLCGGVSTF